MNSERERTFTGKELIERIKGRDTRVLIKSPWGTDVPVPKAHVHSAAMHFATSMWKLTIRDDGILIHERIPPVARA